MHFNARAINEHGLTFSFRMTNPNWVGIRARAEEVLEALTEADPLHQENGPWSIDTIDVSR